MSVSVTLVNRGELNKLNCKESYKLDLLKDIRNQSVKGRLTSEMYKSSLDEQFKFGIGMHFLKITVKGSRNSKCKGYLKSKSRHDPKTEIQKSIVH